MTPRGRASDVHWIGGWVGPRIAVDDVGKSKFLTLPGLEFRLLGRQARSQSLHQLRLLENYVLTIAYVKSQIATDMDFFLGKGLKH
jgi:hypothetical protein